MTSFSRPVSSMSDEEWRARKAELAARYSGTHNVTATVAPSAYVPMSAGYNPLAGLE